MTLVAIPDQRIIDFGRHLQFSSPFETNRVSDASQPMPASVPAIHADAYEQLALLVQRVHQRGVGAGAVLMGEAGVGKSHLLARLWHGLRGQACVTFLHNVQASPDRLPRYVLRCVLGQVAKCSADRRDDSLLSELIAAAIRKALGSSPSATMAAAHQAFQHEFVKPALEAGHTDQAMVYEFLFSYFRSNFQAHQRGESVSPAADLAIRWLGGDTLDENEIGEIGLPDSYRDLGMETLPDDQAVESVMGAVARLASAAGKTFVIMFDQVDNLSEDQVSTWARFAHSLIDHVPNLLVITSGVRGRLKEMQQSGIVNPASWDRIAQHRIDIGRITPDESRELLEARLASFVEPFSEVPEIQDWIAADGLFPLGSDWFTDRVGEALDVRPRDVINWAQDQFYEIAKEIKQQGCEQWLADWKGNLAVDPVSQLPMNAEDRQQKIDAAINGKLKEQCHHRRLNPETLPADAGNLLGLVEGLLSQCLETSYDYSLVSTVRVTRGKRDPVPAYDLMVEELTPEGERAQTGIKFVATGSKVSMAAALRRLEAVTNPPDHTLLVTEERCPLQLGKKGRERLAALESQGKKRFGIRELSFDDHCQLDALQSVIGLANSGDLEVRVAGGDSDPVGPDTVIESYHRCDRYQSIGLLCELLTEESLPVEGKQTADHSNAADEQELQDYVLGQLATTACSSLQELTEKYLDDTDLNEDQAGSVGESLDRAVTELHRSGRVSATAQDGNAYVTLPDALNSCSKESELGTRATTPVHFTVTQVRQAAACPRLLHLDAEYSRTRKLKRPRVTRIWQGSDLNQDNALGTLFHQTVEAFNDSAARCPELKSLLANHRDGAELHRPLHDLIVRHANKKRLSSAAIAHRDNYHLALQSYTNEFADVLSAGLKQCGSAEQVIDQMFGDLRKTVDVTFDVGPNDQKVRITGRLDYVFYDWQRDRHRIVDYKLTPGLSVEADLYQVCVYALMHHQQHGTKPDVELLYLHPNRMVREMPWEEVYGRRHEVYDLLASMVQWQDFQAEPPHGLHPPGNSAYCATCLYSKRCSSRLGAVGIGDRSQHWIEAASSGIAEEPVIHRSSTNENEPAVVLDVDPPAVVQNVAVDADQQSESSGPPELPAEPSEATAPPQRSEESSPAIFMGTTSAGESVALPLEMLPSHIALVGAAGSGKTWMAKVIAEGAIQQGVPVIAIDPQGDLVQFLRQSESASDGNREHDEYWQRVEPRVFTPGSTHGTRLSINPIRFTSEADLGKFGSKERRREEQQNMLSATVTNLVNFANAGGDTDMQCTFLMKVVRGLQAGRSGDGSDPTLRGIASAIRDPESIGIDDSDQYLPKTQRDKLSRKLMALLEGPQAKLFRDGTPIDIDAFCRPSEPGKTPLNVIYLNALTSDAEKQFFVASLVEEVYRWMTTSLESSGQPKLLLYLDEARDFIPAGTKKTPAKEPLIRMFSQGRKFGVSCLICTQSPRSVDYNIFGNCSTKLIGRLESAQDVDRVAEWFSTDGGRPKWLAKRKAAERGSFVTRWPEMPAALAGAQFKGRPLFSFHGGAWSPDRVEQECES